MITSKVIYFNLFYLYISICVTIACKLYLEMLHSGLPGSCLGLLCPAGLGLATCLGLHSSVPDWPASTALSKGC